MQAGTVSLDVRESAPCDTLPKRHAVRATSKFGTCQVVKEKKKVGVVSVEGELFGLSNLRMFAETSHEFSHYLVCVDLPNSEAASRICGRMKLAK